MDQPQLTTYADIGEARMEVRAAEKGELIIARRMWCAALWAWVWALRGFQDKTLWDWMALLIVPAVIALAGWWLSEASTWNQHKSGASPD